MDIETLAFVKNQARKDLLSFCVFSDKFFEINKHHEIIADALQRFMEWKTKKLILQTPPRSWKSRLICEAIAWAFGNIQNTDIIYTWHSISLLESFSRNIRDRVNSPEYKTLFKDTVKWDNWAVWAWSMTNSNQLMIYWVWWGITGKWGNRLIIDDPYATRQDAESDTIRKRVEDWYDSTFLSRRHNSEAGICLIMQRWREDDLVWYILEKEKDWEIVKIPAINEEWESFWESRFPVPYLEDMRTVIWDYFFSSQYQQEPFIDWGWSFKKDYFMEYENPPSLESLKVYTFIDPAISQKQEADFTAIVTIGIDQNNRIYVLDIFHERVEPSDSINALFEIVKKYRPDRVWVEVVAFQKMLALEIRKQMNIRNTFFNLDEITPMWEKNSRIKTILEPRYSNINILHPKYNKNTKDLELELLKFPNGKHDDIIDALSWVVRMAEVESYGDNDYVRTHSYNNLFK